MNRITLKTMLSFFLTVLFTQINYAQTVNIGKQIWMTKNLNVDKFRNGDPIPEAKTDAEWLSAGENEQPAWCYYDNDPANGAKYGKLYNWFAVNDNRGLAPEGYHIPSDEEWITLENYLGVKASQKMKNTSGWDGWTTGGYKTCSNCEDLNAEARKKAPCHTCRETRSVAKPEVMQSINGTNSSGFSGYAGGFRLKLGTFGNIGKNGDWWSSTELNPGEAYDRFLNCSDGNVGRSINDKEIGFSVRCLKD